MNKDYTPFAYAGTLYNQEARETSTVLGHCWARSRAEAEGLARESLKKQWPESELSSTLMIREIEGAVYKDTVTDAQPESELHWLDRNITMRTL